MYIKEEAKRRLAIRDALTSGKSIKQTPPVCQDQVPYTPVLIIIPPTVVPNWSNHLKQWGHFSVKDYNEERDSSIHKIKTGACDILLYPNSFVNEKHFKSITDINWSLVIIDEYHSFKNKSNKKYEQLKKLRVKCRCPLIGLTGTPMQNNYKVR